MKPYSVIGRKTPRVDARAKAIGEAKFAVDILLPGMLHGKVLRSTHPHARIIHIDTSKAKRSRGVRAVITAEDIPDVRYGSLIMDMGVLARAKVRYIGEAVAAVAAIDEDTALEALESIAIEYEDLIPVFDPLEAMHPGAPIIHENLEEYLTLYPRTEKTF